MKFCLCAYIIFAEMKTIFMELELFLPGFSLFFKFHLSRIGTSSVTRHICDKSTYIFKTYFEIEAEKNKFFSIFEKRM